MRNILRRDLLILGSSSCSQLNSLNPCQHYTSCLHLPFLLFFFLTGAQPSEYPCDLPSASGTHTNIQRIQRGIKVHCYKCSYLNEELVDAFSLTNTFTFNSWSPLSPGCSLGRSGSCSCSFNGLWYVLLGLWAKVWSERSEVPLRSPPQLRLNFLWCLYLR